MPLSPLVFLLFAVLLSLYTFFTLVYSLCLHTVHNFEFKGQSCSLAQMKK